MLKRQIVLYTVFFFSNCFSLFADNREPMLELMLREVGNDFLLELGDSTSRVLPIESEGNLHVVKFDREFSFDPELLVSITRNSLNQFDSTGQWLIEVKTCGEQEVVHSFQLNPSKEVQGIACRLRELPLDCYFFAFSNLAKHAEQDQSQAIPFNEDEFSQKTIYTIVGIIIAFVVLTFFFFVRKRKSSNPNHFKKIGKFEFDEHKMTLTLNLQTIELSGKESKLLSLLYQNKNETLERDKILSKVWGDEGDYVGRTLDVFISKLRKKLAFDEEIEIMNIRGIGYRLVIP